MDSLLAKLDYVQPVYHSKNTHPVYHSKKVDQSGEHN